MLKQNGISIYLNYAQLLMQTGNSEQAWVKQPLVWEGLRHLIHTNGRCKKQCDLQDLYSH